MRGIATPRMCFLYSGGACADSRMAQNNDMALVAQHKSLARCAAA
jgi:hypothetical protein